MESKNFIGPNFFDQIFGPFKNGNTVFRIWKITLDIIQLEVPPSRAFLKLIKSSKFAPGAQKPAVI